MSLLNVNELVQFAVRIEENGEKFYREWAQRVEEPEQKAFFKKLADDEVKHKELYVKMLGDIRSFEPDIDSYEEYMAYMKMFSDGVLFNEEKNREQMKGVKTMGQALDFAAQQELDSILFYLELKSFVPKDQEDIVSEVVREERRHYVDLLKARRNVKD